MRNFILAISAVTTLAACSKTSTPPDSDEVRSDRSQTMPAGAAIEAQAPAPSTAPDSTLTPAQHQANCDHVAKLYRACGAKFDYDGKTFTFNVGKQKKRVVCTDGRQLGFFDRVDQMDVSSIFMFKYLEGNSPLPEVRMHYDAGRLRVEELLMNVYGHDESAARAQLVKVTILGQTVPFSRSFGAAKALQSVDRELAQLMKTDPAVKKFLEPFTSKKEQIYTFFWRVVEGTTRLSAHSFGIGIDLLTHVGPQYWLWDEKATNPERAKQGEKAYRDIHFIPKGPPQWNQKVVDVLERNGFIWGGKWNHYDTMHWEYRPEFITNAKPNCAPLDFRDDGFEPMSDAEIDAYVSKFEHLDH